MTLHGSKTHGSGAIMAPGIAAAPILLVCYEH
jgi:hypothetical protein